MSHYIFISNHTDRFQAIRDCLGRDHTECLTLPAFDLGQPKERPQVKAILIDAQECTPNRMVILSEWGDSQGKAPIIALAPIGDEGAAAEAIRSGAQQLVMLDEKGHYLTLLPTVIKSARKSRKDADARASAEDSVLHLAKELSTKHQELEAFAHTVASDLKNPLSTIMGFIEVLDENYASLSRKQVHTYLNRIYQMSHQSVDTIDALLLFSKIDKQYVEFEPVAIQQIIEGVLQRLDDQIEQSNATLIFPPEWPICEAYTPWVEKIWMIYVSNALKFGGTPPTIEFGYDYLAEDRVRIWIEDDGPGIALEQQSAIFDPFTRLTNHTATHAGLNLSIVQRLALRMNGHVGFTSEPGRGSRFYFDLPLFTRQTTTFREQPFFDSADFLSLKR